MRVCSLKPVVTVTSALLISSTIGRQPARAASFIVKDGRPRAEIVVGHEPARAARFAAQELQAHVEKITGATLPILPQPTGEAPVKVYVGRKACADGPNLSADALKHGAFRMNSGEDWLALTGNDWEFTPIEPWPRRRGDLPRVVKQWDQITGDTFGYPYWRLYRQYNETFDLWDFDDRGTINAVHEFLRSLGVRWYFPSELGTIIPTRDSIPLPKMNQVVRPDFPMRCMVVHSANANAPVFLWKTRLGVNYPYDLLGLAQVCHGTKFITMRDEMKEAHREIYRVVAGRRATDHKRGQGSPCLSVPLFYEKQRAFARVMFDHYQSPMLSLDVSDGFGACQCELCEGTTRLERGWEGALSDHVWGYVNRLAQDLYKTHPDHGVSGLSYGAYRMTPQSIDRLSPNITLVYCQHRSSFGDPDVRRKFVERRNAWLEILTSKKMYTFDFHLMNKSRSAYAGVPAYFPRPIAEDIRSLRGVSLGDFLEVGSVADPDRYPWDPLAVDHLNDYVTARFWWNADQDLDALLDEYFDDLYGPASNEMKAYVEYCSQNWKHMLSNVEPITRSLDLLQKARAAAGETVYGQRVDKIVTYTARLNEIRQRMTQKRENVPDVRALPRPASDLTLDGKLDDKFWRQTRTPRMMEIQTGRKPFLQTRFHIAWARNGALCLGLRCDETDMKNLALGATEDNDPGIWMGDFIDVLIETQVHSYYQITLNPAGAVMDLDRGAGKKKNYAWSSNAEVAVHHGEDYWSAEVRLPCAGPMAEEIDPLLGIAGRVPTSTYPWYINVCRQRVRGKDVELSAWSPTGTDRFNVPARFGKIYIK